MDTVTIAAVGDMMFDTRPQTPRIFYHYPDFSSCTAGFEGHFRIPFPCTADNQEWLESLQRPTYGIAATAHGPTCRYDSAERDVDYPFQAVRSELDAADMVFGNLECPLSQRGRRSANDISYRASPEYAGALARAGFRVVSLANNHAFDYGEVALADTLEALRASGIQPVGAGTSLTDARKPAVVTVEGIRIGFLAYCMVGSDVIYATAGESGVAPANPRMIAEDAASLRSVADIVVVSIHWGIELRSLPWPRMVEFARDMIDCGADAVLGHHSHVAGSVEIYRNRPILYSLGNFSFGHQHENWSCGMLARLSVSERGIEFVRMSPLTPALQPAFANSHIAASFHDHLRKVSDPSTTERLAFDGTATVLPSR